MSESALRVDIENGIATLCFNRPEAKNAMNTIMRGELYDAVVRIRADRDVRAVILRGAGRDFCSGGAVLEIVEPEQLYARSAQIAASLAGASPVAFGLAKRALNQSLGSDLRTMLEIESAAQGIAFTTDYHHEAARRFREKSEPLFKWPAREA